MQQDLIEKKKLIIQIWHLIRIVIKLLINKMKNIKNNYYKQWINIHHLWWIKIKMEIKMLDWIIIIVKKDHQCYQQQVIIIKLIIIIIKITMNQNIPRQITCHQNKPKNPLILKKEYHKTHQQNQQ